MKLKVLPVTDGIAWKSTKAQAWSTTVKEAGSGKERVLTNWAYPRWTIETSYSILTPEAGDLLYGFFASLRGRYEPFLWPDPEHNAEHDIQLGIGTGAKAKYQALRRFGAWAEPVLDLKPDTLEVKVDDVKVEATADDNGIITLAAAPPNGAKVTASYGYYWRVRLSDDKFTIEVVLDNIWRSKSMKLVTVR